jgi:hypothetical protein
MFHENFDGAVVDVVELGRAKSSLSISVNPGSVVPERASHPSAGVLKLRLNLSEDYHDESHRGRAA